MRSAVSTVNEVSARALAPSATHATTSAHERSATFADILLGGRSRVVLPDMAPRGRGSAVAWRSGFRGGVECLDDGSLASRFEASARGKWAGRARIFSCFVAKRASTRNKPCTIYIPKTLTSALRCPPRGIAAPAARPSPHSSSPHREPTPRAPPHPTPPSWLPSAGSSRLALI